MAQYIGRFAPSPSGALHMGSLVTALGSYLRARSQQGTWLVRIDDIDPPREVPGATQTILNTLERFGLKWDQEVFYQSQRVDTYQEILNSLLQQKLAYACACTRKDIAKQGGVYQGTCRDKQLSTHGNAIRLLNQHPCFSFFDEHLGTIQVPTQFAAEDFILKRRDGLYAYQLAVVLDDAYQKITEVVRGADLLETSARHISMANVLQLQVPKWLHLPLVVQPDGRKLSKQNHAEPIEKQPVIPTLMQALSLLNQPTHEGMLDLSVECLLNYAVEQFNVTLIPKTHQSFSQD